MADAWEIEAQQVEQATMDDTAQEAFVDIPKGAGR